MKQRWQIYMRVPAKDVNFVSGHLELAKKTKANIGLSSEANAEFDFTALDNGHLIQLGDITCEVLHTPGHTPESMVLWSPINQTEKTLGLFSRETQCSSATLVDQTSLFQLTDPLKN